MEIAHKLLRKLAIDKDKEDRPGEIQLAARPGRREEKRDNVYLIDLSVNPLRARLLEAARRRLYGSVSSICNKEVTNLQIDDTTKKQPALPHPKEWLVASIKQLDGWEFASKVSLDELSLLK